MSQPPNQRNMPYGGGPPPHHQQQQQQQQHQQGYNPGRPGTSAWQPAAPTSHQMAGQQMYQQQQQRQGMMPQQYSMQNPYAMQQYMMQQYYQHGYAHPEAMQQQQQQQHRGPEGAYQGNMYGGAAVYAPPPNMQQQQQRQGGQQRPTIQPPAAKKISVITDKDGKPIDFGGLKTAKAAAAAAAPATTTEGTKPVVAVTPATTDAGAMMRQKALEALQRDKDNKKKAEEEAAAKKKAEEEAAQKKAEEEAAAKKAEEEAAAKKKAEEEAAAKKAEEEAAAKKKAEEEAAKAKAAVKRRVYTKEEMLRLRSLPVCMTRPDDLPEREIVKGPARAGGGGGGGGGGDRRQRNEGGGSWQRGAAPPNRRNSTEKGERRGSTNAGQWARGQAPPKPQNRGGRGGRGGQQPFYDGPVEKLVKSENAWRPKKNVNAAVAAEKAIKSILNKMTKEKFERLSTQMCDIPISSYEILALMIGNVFEKAVDEPTFGDMYGDLCVRLSEKVQTDSFVQIIESDEEPPTDDGETAQPGTGESSANAVYRWSNDVSTTDSELVGPFQSVEECFDAALSGEDIGIVERGEMELELVKLQIKQGIFVKVLKKKVLEEGEEGDMFYTVYFPVADAEECGQQLSKIFLSEVECSSDARKENSFKRTLLNKCQDEFSKEDIYVDWKKEKAAYEETKDKLTEAERNEQEEELEFRRMKIKKQMLGNVKFIGQLYKKSLIKEKIMLFCVSKLLKLQQDETIKSKTPVYNDTGDMDIDDEDHEAICSMFTTIGSTIDKGSGAPFVNLCFEKIKALSVYKKLGSRTRFMYKDLIELRENKWVPRRTTEKAKTIGEIRKDFEREMREQKEQDQQMAGNFRGGGGPRGGDFGRNDRRGSDFRANPRASNFGSGKGRPAPKPATETDDDGFTTIVSGGNKKTSLSRAAAQAGPQRTSTKVETKQTFAALADDTHAPSAAQEEESEKLPEPLDSDKLKRRIASIRGEYMQDPSNTEELLMSVDELRGTPEYGVKFIEENADRLIDCNDAERSSINSMLKVLVENGKISGEDVSTGLEPIIECLDSMVIDAPKAYEYFGDFMSTLISVKALEISYICQEAFKMLEFSPQAPGDIMMALAQSMKTILGVEEAKSELERNAADIEKLIGAEKWAAVKASI